MPITIETYSLPRHWEKHICGGTDSYLTDEEKAHIDTWMQERNLPAPCNVETHPDFLDLLVYYFAIKG